MSGRALHCARPSRLGRKALLALATLLAVACSSGPEPATVGRSQNPSTTAATTTSLVTTTTIPDELLDLIDGVGMTTEGRGIFLATRPNIEDAATFANSCDDLSDTADEKAHTHGCFAGGRIHMRAVGSPQIADLIYVVAAHELLHAVYVQMSAAERVTIDAQLDTLRRRTPLLRERLEAYASTDAIAAEAHSLAATELSTLPAPLEAHYARYIDRPKVVAAFEKSLGGRDREIRTLRALVTDLDARIDDERAQLDALEATGDINAFNAAVQPFNELVAERNRQADTLNSRVQAYNRLIAA